MAGDYTRFRYNPRKDASGILMQQGKVLVDQDWNEHAELQNRRWRTETTDIIGRAVVPIETPTGFEILISGTNLTIGRGRMYVDGLLAENHGADPLEFDPVLGEVRGTQPVPYDQQPYYPDPPALPTDTDPHLVYLDVWEREVTYLEDADLIDKAIAVDTATRIQAVWQVKLLQDTPAGTSCSTPSSAIAETAPSAGRLTTAAAGVPSSADPCLVPLTGGYRGSGNRLYRVELHTGGPLGAAQWKWSRDNASVVSAVTAINASLDTVTVVMTKRDSVLRFQPNDWVEVTDDIRFFHGLPGEMAQIAVVNDVNLAIQLKNPLPAGTFDATNPDRHTRVIRWDQSGIVRDSLGNAIVDLDTTNGLIPVPAAGVAVVLEDGIEVTFSIDGSMPVPQFRPLEYWSFAARVVDASIEILTEAPPRGILHHYAWLGFVTFPSSVTSCRVFWPPDMGESCDCTVCVSATSHNTGTLTIQAAINQVKGKGGGKVCLGPGVYNINATIVVAGASAIEIAGHGMPSLQATSKLLGMPIMLVERSINITVEDVMFAAGVEQNASLPGLVLRETFFVRVTRCAFVFGIDGTLIGNGRTLEPAIGLAGVVADTDVKDNFFNNVAIAIGDIRGTKDRFLRALSIESNQMVCAQAGIRLVVPPTTIFSELRCACNLIQSPFGFTAIGHGLDVTVNANTFNLVAPAVGFGAVMCAAVWSTIIQSRITNNQIVGDGKTPDTHGVMLGIASAAMYGTRVTGNQIASITGNGISVMAGAMVLDTIIAQNQMLGLGNGGIVMLTDANGTSAAVDLNIYENALTFVAQVPDKNAQMIGIMLVSAFNVNVCDNAVENLGMTSGLSASRFGIIAVRGTAMRVTGNRLTNIGPPGPVALSAGIAAVLIAGRLDIADNLVRRSTAPPPQGDSSPFLALAALTSGDASIRGNQLECFGDTASALVAAGSSCIFSENQCLFENPTPNAVPIVMLSANAVIASANFVKGPRSSGGAPGLAMRIDSTGPHSVLGNIATGTVLVNAASLPPAPQIPQAGQTLNVVPV